MAERFIGWFCLDMPATLENLFSCRRVEPFATGERVAWPVPVIRSARLFLVSPAFAISSVMDISMTGKSTVAYFRTSSMAFGWLTRNSMATQISVSACDSSATASRE